MGSSQSQLPIISYYDRNNKKIHDNFYPNYKGIVEMNQQKWNAIATQIILQNIKSWNILYNLQVKMDRGSIILKQISHIKFPFLMNLSLAGNNIDSIQYLGQMWFIGLQSINLSNNNIVYIKELRKLKAKLKSLKLTYNKILDYEELVELYSRRQRNLRIQINKRDRYELIKINKNPRWILKTKFCLDSFYSSQIVEYFPVQGYQSDEFGRIYRKARKVV